MGEYIEDINEIEEKIDAIDDIITKAKEELIRESFESEIVAEEDKEDGTTNTGISNKNKDQGQDENEVNEKTEDNRLEENNENEELQKEETTKKVEEAIESEDDDGIDIRVA